jgi:uncharacterized protein DUF899
VGTDREGLRISSRTIAALDIVEKSVKFSELFAGKNTLLLYSFMYGPNWDKPCPSCTSLVSGFESAYQADYRYLPSKNILNNCLPKPGGVPR